MPKPRKAGTSKAPTTEQIEAFAAGAEPKTERTAPAVKKEQTLDPTAPRNFKALKLGLNEHEYLILEEASRRAGRSKLNFIRHAMLTMAKEVD